MKSSLFKLFVGIIFLGASCVCASAQTKQITHDFSTFDAIDVDYDFSVNVLKSESSYSVSLTVDDVLTDYVQTYVKNHTLYITLDKKNLPSDVKKLYKGRKSEDPVLNATVYLPSQLTGVNLHGASQLFIENEIECKTFEATVTENATIKKLSVDAEEFSISAANKAAGDIVVYADNVTIKAEGNSKLNVEQSSEKLTVDAGGNCDLAVEGEALDVIVKASVSAAVVLTGKSDNLEVTTSGAAKVDALNLKTRDCTADLSGNSKLTEAATDNLHVTMAGGSTLVYDGQPAFDIINVKNSSIVRYGNSKK